MNIPVVRQLIIITLKVPTLTITPENWPLADQSGLTPPASPHLLYLVNWRSHSVALEENYECNVKFPNELNVYYS